MQDGERYHWPANDPPRRTATRRRPRLILQGIEPHLSALYAERSWSSAESVLNHDARRTLGSLLQPPNPRHRQFRRTRTSTPRPPATPWRRVRGRPASSPCLQRRSRLDIPYRVDLGEPPHYKRLPPKATLHSSTAEPRPDRPPASMEVVARFDAQVAEEIAKNLRWATTRRIESQDETDDGLGGLRGRADSPRSCPTPATWSTSWSGFASSAQRVQLGSDGLFPPPDGGTPIPANPSACLKDRPREAGKDADDRPCLRQAARARPRSPLVRSEPSRSAGGISAFNFTNPTDASVLDADGIRRTSRAWRTR
jgi:hypothetical protein